MAGDGREGARANREAPRGSAGTVDVPPLDPTAVQRSYQVHRARRRARIEHGRRNRWAGARFWVVLLLLTAACALLALTTWREIGRLFGL